MAKTYRAIQQWDHWLNQFLGHSLLAAEQQFLPTLLKERYGKHTLLIGSPSQEALLNASEMPFHLLLSPLHLRHKTVISIESTFYELPIASGSIDLVLLPHTLEHVDNPRKLLAESCRIVKPEGHIIIFGFNPYSLWGIKKILMRSQHMPWAGNFIASKVVKNWLTLDDFELCTQHKILFRPATNHPKLYERMKFFEWLGNKFFYTFGSVYILEARAKVIPLTPIKLSWQQKLSGMLPTTRLSGSSMRKDFL